MLVSVKGRALVSTMCGNREWRDAYLHTQYAIDTPGSVRQSISHAKNEKRAISSLGISAQVANEYTYVEEEDDGMAEEDLTTHCYW